MFKYKQPTTCYICDKKEQETWHFDIYTFGSEGVILCLPCIIDVLTNCEKDENLEARRAVGKIIHDLSLSEFSKRWKEKIRK